MAQFANLPNFRSRLRSRPSIVEYGILVRAILLQANNIVFQDGSGKTFKEIPCLVMFSFDACLNADPQTLGEAGQRALALKRTNPRDPANREVSEIMKKERAVRYRRRALPAAYTDVLPTIYTADLFVEARHLSDGHLTQDDHTLLCFASPDGKGGIELVPYSLLVE